MFIRSERKSLLHSSPPILKFERQFRCWNLKKKQRNNIPLDIISKTMLDYAYDGT